MKQDPPMPDRVSIHSTYQPYHIWLGTWLGGPLVAGYMMAENFKTLDEPGRVVPTWICTIACTILIFAVGLFVLPEEVLDKIPNFIIPLFNAALAAAFVEIFQTGKLKSHFIAGGRTFGLGRVVLIGVIGAVIQLAILLLCAAPFLIAIGRIGR